MEADKAKADSGVNATEVLRKAGAFTEGVKSSAQPLAHGSDVELATHAARELEKASGGQVVYCEGELHFYDGKYWEPVEPDALRRLLHRYDGAVYGPNNAKVRL